MHPFSELKHMKARGIIRTTYGLVVYKIIFQENAQIHTMHTFLYVWFK